MNKPSMIDQRKYVWDYFTVHASQRLTTFNFYLVISILLVTGICTTFKSDLYNPHIGFALAFTLSFLSFIFWKLDERNREVIGIAEQALMLIEKDLGPDGQNGEPHFLQIFNREKYQTDKLREIKNNRFWKNHLCYSDCFRFVFRTFGWGGVALSFLQVVMFIENT